MHINLDLYRVFYEVAIQGSISKAAQSLHLTQPAVSQSIKLLEDQLDCILFYRSSKGVKLTNHGNLILEDVKVALEHFNHVEKLTKQLKNNEIGELKIGASDSVCEYYLIDRLIEYQSNYPNIKLQVFNETSYHIIDMVINRDIDIGFVNLPIKDIPAINVYEIEKLTDIIICSKSNKELLGRQVALKELEDYPFILLEKNSNTRKLFDDVLLSNKISINPKFELSSLELMIKFVEKGMGLSFVTKNYILDQLDNKDLFEVKTMEAFPQRSIGMITSKDTVLSSISKNFMSEYLDYEPPLKNKSIEKL